MTDKLKVESESIKVVEEKITKEKYDEAVLILQKQEEAKAIIEKFEAEQKFAEDPAQEIIEKGTKTILTFEEIPNRNIARITSAQYEYLNQTVIEIIEYMNNVDSRSFLDIKTIKTELK